MYKTKILRKKSGGFFNPYLALADENTCDCREYEVDRNNAAMLKTVKQSGKLAERKYCIAKRDHNNQKAAATKLE